MISPTSFVPSHSALNAALERPAFIDETEIPVLCKYAANAMRIVEIGAAWGASSTLMLMHMPDGAHLSSIDPFVPDSVGGFQASYPQCIQAVYTALATFGHLHRFKDWSLIEQTSAYVAERWAAPTPIDLLYVDGSHLTEDVETDWAMWTPFVRPLGVVVLHDSRKIDGAPDEPYPQGYEAPTALANRLRTDAGWRLIEEVFSMTVWEKVEI